MKTASGGRASVGYALDGSLGGTEFSQVISSPAWRKIIVSWPSAIVKTLEGTCAYSYTRTSIFASGLAGLCAGAQAAEFPMATVTRKPNRALWLVFLAVLLISPS